MKSPDRDAADDLIVRLETFQRAAVTQQAHDLFREAASELATLRRRVDPLMDALEVLLAEYLALVEDGDSGFWDFDPETNEGVIKARAALSPPTRKE